MRYTKAILLSLFVLVYAGMAGAATMTAVQSNDCSGINGSCYPSESVIVDIMFDSEGALFKSVAMYVDFDPGLSPVSQTVNPIPGIDFVASPWLYPNSFYFGQTSFGGLIVPATSIATLVFHVMDVPNSTILVVSPNLDYGAFGAYLQELPGGQPVFTDLAIHVPEPTTTMLMGLGLFGILYAGRRR